MGEGVTSIRVRPYVSITGLYLARGWALWVLRHRRRQIIRIGFKGGLFMLVVFASYQAGFNVPTSTPSQLASASSANLSSSSSVASVKTAPTPVATKPPAPVAATPQPTPVAQIAVQNFAYSRKPGNNYAYGNCTYYVANRRAIPGNWGNARSWMINAQRAGFATGTTPRVGAIAWTPAGYLGHVAIVEAMVGDSVKISEMNYNGGLNRVDTRTVPASSFQYIY